MNSESDNVLKRCRPTRYRDQDDSSSSQAPLQQLEYDPQDGEHHSEDEADHLQHVMRGPHTIMESMLAEEAKPEVWPVGPAEFDSNPRVSKIALTINKLALNNTPGPFRTLNSWTKTGKDNLRDDFLDRFRWHHKADPRVCREVLEVIASKGYSGGLRRVRAQYTKDYGPDTANWKTKVPLWCKKPHAWIGLCDIWASDSWKKLAAKNKVNRCKSGRIVTHFSGSASAYRHSQILKAKLGRDPTYEELFVHIHVPRGGRKGKGKIKNTKGKGKEVVEDAEGAGTENAQPQDNSAITTELNWADEKSKDVYERAQLLKQDPANADKSEQELWIMATGGPSHGRIYGFGSKIDKRILPTSKTRSKSNLYYGSSSAQPDEEETRMYTAQEVEDKFAEQKRQFEEESTERKKMEQERFNRYDTWIA